MIPAEANVIARRVPIPLFGAGLVDAIPDETLLALADPLDLDRDGVSGRAAIVEDLATGDLRVGRFGWKSQQPTLLAFGADAYLNEMGITSDLFPNEQSFGISPELMALCDPIPDPEDIRDRATGRRGIDNFESFMQFLAPIARGPIDAQVRAGELMFDALGCAACHVPSLRTGPSTNPLFDRKMVPLYSDLLLHDVGTGDGIGQASAAPSEIRTPALWGPAVPSAAAARRPRGDRRRCHPLSWRGGRSRPSGVRRPRSRRSRRRAGLPQFPLIAHPELRGWCRRPVPSRACRAAVEG